MQIIVLVFLCSLFALSVVSVRWMFAFSLVFFAFEVALEGTLEIFKSNLTLANYIVDLQLYYQSANRSQPKNGH